eukprot:3049246-Pleurochrysis_carterae.AAC.1
MAPAGNDRLVSVMRTSCICCLTGRQLFHHGAGSKAKLRIAAPQANALRAHSACCRGVAQVRIVSKEVHTHAPKNATVACRVRVPAECNRIDPLHVAYRSLWEAAGRCSSVPKEELDNLQKSSE